MYPCFGTRGSGPLFWACSLHDPQASVDRRAWRPASRQVATRPKVGLRFWNMFFGTPRPKIQPFFRPGRNHSHSDTHFAFGRMDSHSEKHPEHHYFFNFSFAHGHALHGPRGGTHVCCKARAEGSSGWPHSRRPARQGYARFWHTQTDSKKKRAAAASLLRQLASETFCALWCPRSQGFGPQGPRTARSPG